MKYAICTLPNASDVINYVHFIPHERGMISAEPLSDADAEQFAQVPGFEIVDGQGNAPAAPVENTPAPDFNATVVNPADAHVDAAPADAAPADAQMTDTSTAPAADAPAADAAPAKNPVPANFQKKPAAK